jgi:hypothetical protein
MTTGLAAWRELAVSPTNKAQQKIGTKRKTDDIIGGLQSRILPEIVRESETK